ncbi:MAG: SDR family NAD(P)-dependent oxidoreductase [Ardenticatenaceae bacterium]|nr:SDR family NAD(P)-dependent oxidoreductase [Ardenticatenaceae bacterium]
MTNLNRATILITGAAGGFGREMIKQFLGKSGRLILTDVDEARLTEVAHAVQQQVGSGEIVACVAADLATAVGCQKLYAFCQSLALPLDVLVNNAGLGVYGRFDETPAERWEQVMAVNLLAPMRLIHTFVPDMIARGRGHLVNMSSIAGWVGSSGLATYAASKYGLRGFGEALCEELKPYGVRVTAVYPFFSRTPILDSPRFGVMQRGPLPDEMVTNPADVIGEVVRGIEQNKQHIFPDKTARQMHMLKRYWPGLLQWVTRRLEAKVDIK